MPATFPEILNTTPDHGPCSRTESVQITQFLLISFFVVLICERFADRCVRRFHDRDQHTKLNRFGSDAVFEERVVNVQF